MSRYLILYMAVVAGHMVYLSAYASSEIFEKRLQRIRGRLFKFESE